MKEILTPKTKAIFESIDIDALLPDINACSVGHKASIAYQENGGVEFKPLPNVFNKVGDVLNYGDELQCLQNINCTYFTFQKVIFIDYKNKFNPIEKYKWELIECFEKTSKY